MKVILRNKNTNETITVTLEDFKVRFNRELQSGIEAYCKDNKSLLPSFCKKGPTEEDFYQSLRFNFNNYCKNEWYIEKFK